MKNLAKSDIKFIATYILIDLLCVGMGMGVPILCILIGFPLGWIVTEKMLTSTKRPGVIHEKILKMSFLMSAFTFLLMVAIWGVVAPKLFDPSFDPANFGHPFILYDPTTSLIGWLVLMIVISPFLQLLTTIFGSFMTLIKYNK